MGQLEDMEPYMKSSEADQLEMRSCWQKSFEVSVDNDDDGVNISCHGYQLSLMAWLYDGAVSTYSLFNYHNMFFRATL